MERPQRSATDDQTEPLQFSGSVRLPGHQPDTPEYARPRRAPWGSWTAATPRTGTTLRPFQFPSLEHLDGRVANAGEQARGVEGLRETTLRWWADSYRSFRTFLKQSGHEDTFLRGQPEEQIRILGLWIAWCRDHGLSHSAVNTYWRGLRSVFTRLQGADGVLNPLTLVVAPRAGLGQPRCLTRSAAEKVLAFVRNYAWVSRFTTLRNVAIVGLMLLAGLRRAEVVRLHCEDVHTEERSIRIARSKGRFGGKDRTAYMPPQLVAMLNAYLAERRRLRRACPAFLTASRSDTAIGHGTVRELFRVISQFSGVRVTPHSLRHTYATLLRQSGVPDRISMDLLGHSSLQVLQRYSHVFSEEHRREVERLWIDDGA